MNFDTKLARSKPGDEIVYHTGYHCLAGPDFEKRTPDAKSAWDAYLRGDVLLYQRRTGPFQFIYCARVIK